MNNKTINKKLYMKKLIILFATALVILSSCSNIKFSDFREKLNSNKPIETRNELLNAFNSISIRLPYDIEVVQGNKSTIAIKGPANVIKDISVDIDEGKLTLEQNRSFNFTWNSKVEILITTPSLKSLNLTGSGDVNILMKEKQPAMNLELSGSGDVVCNNLVCNNISANVSGSGDLVCSNLKCINIDARVNGSGDALFEGTANNGKFEVHGSGDINSKRMSINVLNLRIGGSGDITYNSPNTTKDVTGSGSCTNYYKK
jgi:hypothetical protein